ncbi:SchA/CurD [Actinomadura sp. CNU-125]|uniref:TcmI family type II polyketide cyclase n=1 Tax=Actinomadura sp. CNU-125 TaxID=1904961 RepID=UPI0009635941|nr:TcmI family type II polyketide cyclase [Actinomadura sp. CNU-125]OLT37076.1 SchA/CurD [Actinomadura sp. CNU-125]
MPYAAITYRVKPGHEEEISEIFANFKRVETPDLHDDDGGVVGSLLGTGVFIKDDVMVRVIHYEGDFAAVARKMSMQPGVHALEEKLQPYLTEERDTKSPQAFAEYFRNALMRSVSQLSADTLGTGR